MGCVSITLFQMCPVIESSDIKAFYIADDIYELSLPDLLESLPQLGEIEEEGVIGYILIANGEEITIIADEEAYLSWKYELHN